MTKIKLGPYVVARPRADGTYRVSQEIPLDRRPPDHPGSMPMPIRGPRTGNLDDADEVLRIQEDSRKVFNHVKNLMSGVSVAQIANKDWATLVTLYKSSSGYFNLTVNTKRVYDSTLRTLLRRMAELPNITPTSATESDIESIIFNDQFTIDNQVHLLSLIKILMNKSIREHWRLDNPASHIILKTPPRTVTLWDSDDVEYYINAASSSGQIGLAAVILCGWEIGQRVGDIIKMKWGEHYADGAFVFRQNKTGKDLRLAAPDRLQDLIETHRSESSYLFKDERGNPFNIDNLYYRFCCIRNLFHDSHLRTLKLQTLRHSCIRELAHAGCNALQIASVSGHAFSTAHQMLEHHYLSRDSTLAQAAMQKREDMRNNRLPPKPVT